VIQACLTIVVPPDQRGGVLQAFRSLLGPTRVAPGCLRCHVYEDVENENAVTYVEHWSTQEDLERHLRSDDYRKLLTLIEVSTVAPELTFSTVSDTAGMEYVAAIRNVPDFQ